MVGPSLDTTTQRHLKPPPPSSTSTIKFLCSYGGKIVPRHSDGKLRYYGGETRVLAVDRFISFSELLLKLGELCGTSVSLRCQLPKEDLDALVSITSDEDLANLIEEYDRSAADTPKIRAFLSVPKKIYPPSSASSSSSSSLSSLSSSPPSSSYAATTGSMPRCYHQISKPVAYPVKKILPPPYHHHHYHHHHQYYCGYHGNPSHAYMVHNGNHWQ